MNRKAIVIFSLFVFLIFAGCQSKKIKENMTMEQIEQLIGKPDRIETIEGKIDEKLYEQPKVIKWVYSKFSIKESGENFGKPGHINFVPMRFINLDLDDSAAHKYGEQANTYRTFSYSGSFPTDKKLWSSMGSFDAIPLKKVISNK